MTDIQPPNASAIAPPPPNPAAWLMAYDAPGLSLWLGITAAKRIELGLSRGAQVFTMGLEAQPEWDTGDTLRILFTWDNTRNQSLLTLAGLGRGTLRQRAGLAPPQISQTEAQRWLASAQSCDWAALGDHVQPVSPGTGVAPATAILTPSGPVAAARLKPGDLVETLDAGPQPVLWVGESRLPGLGTLTPIRLHAPGLGQGLWLAPRHKIALAGPEIEYLSGEDCVLCDARHLVDGTSVLWAKPGALPLVTGWYNILLPGHHLIYAGGCAVESLPIGRMARTPALAETTLLGALSRAGNLPEHGAPPCRNLMAYEAQALALRRHRLGGPVAA